MVHGWIARSARLCPARVGTMKLAPEQYAAFDRDGFLIFLDMLSSAEIETLRAGMELVIKFPISAVRCPRPGWSHTRNPKRFTANKRA